MAEQADPIAEFVEVHSSEDLVHLVCTYAERCYDQGFTVCIYAPDGERAAEIDQRLWTFAQNSFIPHVRLDEAEEPVIEPVVICAADPASIDMDTLILCVDDTAPAGMESFTRVYDFAPVYDDRLRDAARQRFAACQAAGYQMRFTRRPADSP